MILLENLFLQHYFFGVVQTTPIPTQPGGLTIPFARAKQVRPVGYVVADSLGRHGTGETYSERVRDYNFHNIGPLPNLTMWQISVILLQGNGSPFNGPGKPSEFSEKGHVSRCKTEKEERKTIYEKGIVWYHWDR